MSLRQLKPIYWAARSGSLDWRELGSDVRAQFCVMAQLLVSYARMRLRAMFRSHLPALPNASARRLLVVSYYAPPYRSVFGTQRLAKFIKYLSKWGWEIDVITTAPLKAGEVDSRAEQLPASVNVVRLEQSQSRVLRGLLVPDHYVAWIAPSLEAGRQLVRTSTPAAIFATVPPYTNAITAAVLSSETGIPLIVDFRDPWTRIDTVWVLPTRSLRWTSGIMERAILTMSSAIVMADEARYAEEFFVAGGAQVQRKIASVLNGYDEEDFAELSRDRERSSNAKFIISYVGSFYDEPTFLNLVRAFERWHSTFPLELQHVEFHYAGPKCPYFQQYARRLPCVRDHGYVSHQEAIAVRAASNLQIFSQPPSFKPHVISGKIYEMMRVPVPIIAITNPSGTVACFIERTGTGVVVSNADPEAGAVALHDFYEAWRDGREIMKRREDAVAEFSRASQSRQLEAVIERVMF
jgi:glycosyltransferase involved in cell wall biosynthesis